MLLHELHHARLERRLRLRRLGLALRDERIELRTRLAGDLLGHRLDELLLILLVLLGALAEIAVFEVERLHGQSPLAAVIVPRTCDTLVSARSSATHDVARFGTRRTVPASVCLCSNAPVSHSCRAALSA